MGVKFSKVMPLQVSQIVPPEQEKTQVTKLQQRLLDKLGGVAYPFMFKFPVNAPSSVVVQSGEATDNSKPLGVEYRVRAIVAESPDDPGHKRSTVSLAIKKVRQLRAYVNCVVLPCPLNLQLIIMRSCNTRPLNGWTDYPALWLRKASHSRKVA